MSGVSVTPGTPVPLSLADAIKRAAKLSPDLRTATTDAEVAEQDRKIARAGLLPSLAYNNQYLYTQGTGAPAGFKFIANNSVHEYVSQANAHEAISGAQFADLKRASAASAAARARAIVASRGLVAAVVQSYFSLSAAQQKLTASQQAAADASRFLTLSQQLQAGGEVASSDVIKAMLQNNDRRRDLAEAESALLRARFDLLVLVSSEINEEFTLSDSLDDLIPLPPEEQVRELASKDNPEIAAATAAAKAAKLELTGARAAFLPGLSLDYLYGIDAPQFAIHNPDGLRNLGYSASATLSIPIWDWGAIHSRVKQSESRLKLAQTELTFAQRRLLSDLATRYNEARVARSELDLLDSSVHLAEDSLRLTELRYRSGDATILELVDAQNSLTVARVALADGKVRYRVALAGLQTLTGRI
ncbi:MAG TPA: TolC family protein [Terriglobales bacterium]